MQRFILAVGLDKFVLRISLVLLVASALLLQPAPRTGRGAEVTWLPAESIKTIAVSPGNPLAVDALTAAGKHYATGDGGETWAESSDPKPFWAHDPELPGVYFKLDVNQTLTECAPPPEVCARDSLYRSVDGGATWQLLEGSVNGTIAFGSRVFYSLAAFPGLLAVSKRSGSRFGAYDLSDISTSSGTTWSSETITFSRPAAKMVSWALDPRRRGTYPDVRSLYGARWTSLDQVVLGPMPTYAPAIIVTTDSGRSLSTIPRPPGAKVVGSLAWGSDRLFALTGEEPVDPRVDHLRIDVANAHEVWQTANDGKSWFLFARVEPASATTIAYQGTTPPRLLVGTTQGIRVFEVGPIPSGFYYYIPWVAKGGDAW